MKTLSWSDIAVDKDYKYALGEIFHYMYSVENDGAEAMHMACALLERAQNIMNYQDPWDGRENGRWEADKEFVQLNRLMNFMDTIADFAAKRLALLKSGDSYMEQKIADYKRAKSSPHVVMNNGVAVQNEPMSYDIVIELIEDLEQDLLTQGVPRLTLAKCFVDCAFVFAKQRPVDQFIRFCSDLKMMLGHEAEANTSMDVENQIVSEQVPSDVMVSGSVSIH